MRVRLLCCGVLLCGALLVTPGPVEAQRASGDPGPVFGVIHTFAFEERVVREGDGAVDVHIMFEASTPATSVVTVAWETVALLPEGTDAGAEAGLDYVPASGTLRFEPGASSAAATVEILEDDSSEVSELFGLRFHSPVGATLDDPDAVPVRILDRDDWPVVLPGSAVVVEGDEGHRELSLTVTLDRTPYQYVAVDWTTIEVGGLAVAEASPGIDYAETHGTFGFDPGETVATVEIDIVSDTADEPDELLVVSFHSPRFARMGGFWGLGFGGIADDD
jgi:hypothetical protein